ncbi:monocarboxylate transporter [Plakobranchus ocellatus]|uniref:Monocarboxylate transporter n=1 Tax=Plakobranchus ocellatus TaxID=259542 RepID=A0AAV3ZIL0_9GAST|nr:monocarboxylate transporter [Plakobranchus ocellatus]
MGSVWRKCLQSWPSLLGLVVSCLAWLACEVAKIRRRLQIFSNMAQHSDDKSPLFTHGSEVDDIGPVNDQEDNSPSKDNGTDLQLAEQTPSFASPHERQHSLATSTFTINPNSTDHHLLLDDKPHGMENEDNVDKTLEDDKEMTLTVSIEEDDVNAQDKGFAWVIMIGGLLTQIMSGGLSRVNSLFYAQFLERYGESNQLTSWPGAISFTLQSFVAPVAVWFCNRFSVRTAVILGTFLTASGLVITAFAPNIYLLFLSYSILQGIGRGLVMAPGVFIINMYFDKYRGIALGVATSGTGIGTFALAPVFEKLFNILGYRNTMLVIAGISSLSLISAAMFRPYSVHKRMIREKLKKRRKEATEATLESSLKRRNSSFLSYGATNGPQQTGTSVSIESKDDTKSKAATDNGSNLVGERRENRVKSGGMKKSKSYLRTVVETVFPVEGVKGKKSKRKPLFHWALLKDFPFMVLCISMAFYNLAHKTIFAFLAVTCEEQGLTDIEAAYIVSLTGIGDSVGRFAFGLLMDLPRVKPLREIAYSMVLFFAAGAALMVPFSRTLALLSIAGVVYGVMVGSSVSQRSTVLVAMLGKDMVNSALGLLYCSQGIGTLAGPPIAGALKDAFDTYTLAYFMSSGCMAGAGVLVAFSTLLFAIRRRRRAGPGGKGYKRLPDGEAPPIGINSSQEKDEHAQTH